MAVTSATTFGLSPKVTLPVLPFTPVFSAATLVAGQNVATVAGTVNTTAATATAASVTLAPQTVEGTVSAVAAVATGLNAYTVTLPTGSALATATGATTVVVYANSTTQMMNAAAITTGTTVRFNGLLFNDGGTLRLVAGACSDAAGAAPPQKH